MKDILSKKRRLGEVEPVALAKEYSAYLQDKLPSKLKDLDVLPYLATLEQHIVVRHYVTWVQT